MATDTLVESRTISGRGIIRYPNSLRKRYTMLYCDLVRPPSSPYYNTNYNPAKSFYATLVFLRNGYVVREEKMEYDRQVYADIFDITGQNLLAIKCAYAGTLASFANLGTALGLTVTQVTDLIKDYESLRLNWDECRIVCHADTAISATLYDLRYDVCVPTYSKDHPPAPPPNPPARIPPGTPTTISQPYSPGTTDNGNTIPAPLDSENVPPPRDGCSLWEITYRTTLFNGVQDTFARQYKYPYGYPKIGGANNEYVQVTHSGEGINTACIVNGYTTRAVEYSPGLFPPAGGIITNVVIVSEVQIL